MKATESLDNSVASMLEHDVSQDSGTEEQNSNDRLEGLKIGSQIIRVLGFVLPISAISAIALLIHAPYLLSLGAVSFPDAEITMLSLWRAIVFSILTLLASTPFLNYCSTKSNNTPIILGIVISAISIMLTTLSMTELVDKQWHGGLIIGSWATGSLGVGCWIGYLLNEIEKRSVTQLFSIVFFAIALISTATAYSLSIFQYLPRGLGGAKARTVQFMPTQKIAGIEILGSGLTEALVLVYDEPSYYWLQIADQNKGVIELRRIPKSQLGEPLSSNIPFEEGRVRPRKWAIRLNE